MTTAQESLTALGFTALEADIYTSLLRVPSMTGYRIAQVIGKPVANVYKAIESLRVKGAVIVDNSGSRFYRAVLPSELLRGMKRRMSGQIERAESALSRVAPAQNDERTYELLTRDQVIDRARTMLQNAREVALLDLFPAAVKLLTEDLSAGAKRGLVVTAMVYEPVVIPGATVLVNPKGETVRNRWPGEWLNLVVDAKEHLLSFLSPDGSNVLQAVWSASRYLSWVYHSGLGGEMMSIGLMQAIEKRRPRKDLIAIIKQFETLKALQAPGYKELLRKFGKPSAIPHARTRRSV
jgi:sugar-specific transcriptional regulator TrmB